MAEKFVLRLLDAKDQLLAWATVYAAPKPQGRPHSCPFWPVEGRSTSMPVDRSGIATKVTVHWCDLDLARLGQPIEPLALTAGQVVTFVWLEPVWLVPATGQEVPLPPVTERGSVVAQTQAGTLVSA